MKEFLEILNEFDNSLVKFNNTQSGRGNNRLIKTENKERLSLGTFQLEIDYKNVKNLEIIETLKTLFSERFSTLGFTFGKRGKKIKITLRRKNF